ELELVEVELEEQRPFARGGQQGGAVEGLEVGREVAGDAGFLGGGGEADFFLGDDGVDDLGGVVLVVEGVIDQADLAALDAVDAGEEEADAALAVGEDKAAGGQALATPALDGLAGDVEFFGDVVDGEDWLGVVGGAEVEGLGDGLDELAEVVLEGRAGEEDALGVFGTVAGDAVDDEV